MTHISDFAYLTRKNYRDKAKISYISNNLSNSFDKAFKIASTTLLKSLSEAESKKDMLTEQANGILSEIENYNLEQSNNIDTIVEELGDSNWLIESNKASLLSISEMRVIFLFKTIENAIKEILVIAFPKVKKQSLYRWDVIENLLKSNGVELDKLDGYETANQLRKVNNNIKHSDNITEETKKIPHWKRETNFTYENIDAFYNNIHELIIKFMKNLGEAIVIAVYDLTNEKLDEMSQSIFDNLETKRVEMLIKKLEERIKENSK